MDTKISPLVTIVTITFNLIKDNREKLFRQCLESVHNQTYSNIEHLIIDGGSKDGTLDLIQEYEKKGWIKYISEPDKGRYDGMNKGIMLGKGEYIAFINSDDYYHNNNGVELSIKGLLENNADFSYAPVVNQNIEGERETIIPDINKVFCMITPCHQTVFAKRSIMINEGLYNSKYQCVGDYDFMIRLCLKNYKSIYIDKAFTTYRLGGFSEVATRNGLVNKEVTQIYFENYNKLYPISINTCSELARNVYYGNIEDIPLQLAIQLKDFKTYFDINKYISIYENNKPIEPIDLLKLKKDFDLVNNELKQIKSSKGWKIILKIRKISHLLFPVNSLQRNILNRIFNKNKV